MRDGNHPFSYRHPFLYWVFELPMRDGNINIADVRA